MQAAVRALYPDVKRFFRNKLPEPDCYDSAHEAIKAFLAIDPSRIREPKPFLMGVARNHLLKYFARQRPTHEFDSTRMSLAQLGTTMTARLDRHNVLANALRTLALDEQVAFEWHYAEEMTLEQIAEQQGVSRATVVRRLASAREKLRQAIGSTGADLEPKDIQQLADAYRSG